MRREAWLQRLGDARLVWDSLLLDVLPPQTAHLVAGFQKRVQIALGLDPAVFEDDNLELNGLCA